MSARAICGRNIAHLDKRDEVKFVIGSREDYEWSRDKVQRTISLALRRRALLADLRAHRATRNRRMDHRGQTPRALSVADAQVHLEPDTAGSLNARLRWSSTTAMSSAVTQQLAYLPCGGPSLRSG